MIRRVRAGTAVAIAATLVFAAGCGSSGSGDATSGGDGKALTKVTYVTGFGASGQEAFAWVAKEKGYFKEAGLDVDIQLGAGTDKNLATLASGKAQYVHLDFAGALITAGKAASTDYRMIAAVNQHTLVSIVTVEGYGISGPKDLEGKTLAAAPGSVNQKLFPAYARLAGVDATKITWVNQPPAQLPPLLAAHRADGISTYLLRQPDVQKATGGKKPFVLPYGDYLSDLYGGAILTGTGTVKDKPEQVKAFRDALLRGLQYAIDHPDEGGQILHKAQPATDATVAAAELSLMQPFSTAQPIGVVDQSRITKSIALVQSLGLIPAGLTPEKLVDFTMSPKA
jgi:NitT/TauT family transport system substrate-binding protein